MRTNNSTFRALGALPIVGALLLALALPAAANDLPAKDDGKKQEVTLFTAVAKPGDKEDFPKKLVPYKKSLSRVAKAFRLAKSEQKTLEDGKTTSITLPEKLGVAKITWSKKTATVSWSIAGEAAAGWFLAWNSVRRSRGASRFHAISPVSRSTA